MGHDDLIYIFKVHELLVRECALGRKVRQLGSYYISPGLDQSGGNGQEEKWINLGHFWIYFRAESTCQWTCSVWDREKVEQGMITTIGKLDMEQFMEGREVIRIKKLYLAFFGLAMSSKCPANMLTNSKH